MITKIKERPLHDILSEMMLEADQLTQDLLIFADDVDPDLYLKSQEYYEWYERIGSSIKTIKEMVQSKYRREKNYNYRTERKNTQSSKA